MLAFEILFVLLLTVLNGIFAMSEMAVVSSRRARLQQLAASGNAGARTAIRLIDDPNRFLSTVQIGITLIGILAGAFSGATFADTLGDWLDTLPSLAPNGDAIAIGATVVAITYLSLIVGELVPKRIALRSPEQVASLAARPMASLSRLAAPLVWLLKLSTEAMLKLLGLSGAREATVTEDEVKSLIAEGTRAGVFAPQEKDMIEGVLRLADRPVRGIMTPRRDVVWLDVKEDAGSLRGKIAEAGFSRFPLCRGEIDNVIGIVETKHLVDQALRNQPLDLTRAATKPLVVHERTPVLKLLDLFKKARTHIAIAVDEYGALEGIVTLTDITETIAGDLPEREETSGPEAVRREDGSWLIDGMMPIDEFQDRLGLRGIAAAGDFQTLAGFVLHELKHVPSAGEHFASHGARFEVLDMDGRRIDKVLVSPAPSEHSAG
jgi:putative hemolysin